MGLMQSNPAIEHIKPKSRAATPQKSRPDTVLNVHQIETMFAALFAAKAYLLAIPISPPPVSRFETFILGHYATVVQDTYVQQMERHFGEVVMRLDQIALDLEAAGPAEEDAHGEGKEIVWGVVEDNAPWNAEDKQDGCKARHIHDELSEGDDNPWLANTLHS